MARLVVEWDAGERVIELDDQEYQEYEQSGDYPEFFFDHIITDVIPEITVYARVVD